MTPERWKEVEAVLDTALDLPTEARAAYVADACGSDASLRAEVERLLAAIDAPALVPDESAAEFGAPVFARATGTDTPSRPPERIGPYRIVSEAGEGGMGTVYVADRDDGEFAMRVAIKVVRPGLHLDERFRRRFREERTILARLHHPNIARLLDGGVTEDGLPYLVMEYVQGEPLDRWCDGRRCDIGSRLALFAKVCDAVAYLHRHGVVHRDLKPSNIFITAEGEPKLLDFGIAKLLAGADGASIATALTQTGQRLLTPDYASPEQVRGGPVTEASDVYALGVLLFELLTGRRPYRRRGRTLHQIERVILEDEPTRPSSAVTQPVIVDGGVTDGPERAASLRGTTTERLRQQLRGDVDAIVLTALRKEPERRYPSADELALDIRRHLEGQAVTARGDGVTYRVRKLLKRHRVSVAAGTVGAAAGVMLIVIASRAGNLGSGSPARLLPGETRRVAFSPALELDPALSPDGRFVAYAADTGDAMRLYVRPVEGGPARLLTGALDGYHRAPRWSPDGSRIAFQAHARTYVVDVEGGRPPRVLVEADSAMPYAVSPAWSPDGQRIAYVQGSSLYVRDVEGGTPRKLPVETPWPHSLSWSPDGKWLAYADQNFAFLYGSEAAGSPVSLGNVAPSGIQVIAVDGTRPPVQVTNDRALNTSPVWMPDSRTLLYVSNREGDRDVYQLTIGDDGRPRGAPLRVTAGLGAHAISVSRDGRRLAYAVFRGSANVWSLPVRGDRIATDADLRPVTSGSQTIEGMSVSPDGKWIAFDSDRDGRQHVYKAPITGGEPTPLTSGNTDDFMPVWSPDGKELAYYAFDSTGRSIHIVSADGGSPQRVSEWPPQQRFPSWSNDGKSIVFSSNGEGSSQLYVTTRIRGAWARPQQITSNVGGTARWSPTARTIAYLRDDGIWTADADGGVPRQVLRIDPRLRASLGVAEWSADGQMLFYKWFDERRHMTIRAIPWRGGPSREVARLDDPVRQSRRGELATDGKTLYFTIAEHQGDVWVMELNEGR